MISGPAKGYEVVINEPGVLGFYIQSACTKGQTHLVDARTTCFGQSQVSHAAIFSCFVDSRMQTYLWLTPASRSDKPPVRTCGVEPLNPPPAELPFAYFLLNSPLSKSSTIYLVSVEAETSRAFPYQMIIG